MGYNGWKQSEASEKSKAFNEGQAVSFQYNKTICSGKVVALLVNSAIVSINESPHHKDQNEKTVISYGNLMVD
ncbi:hypothetical protein NRIC_26290 [Enterococcus florum]|uniref:Uncharacterized protein n=1 Tax=Enterococcus florum TaxID=2480627 RepID=A0A4P5PEW7_9ENTE|nr:DUF2187 domain-containing protein [Enterococcus florum]GCF94738.1 hypothetical protein NRIC_26290 [Enterococcus florum]